MKLLTLSALSVCLFACSGVLPDRFFNTDARVEAVIQESKNGIPVANIHAVVETDVVASGGDAADDPAIWLHPTTPEKSLILGTDKKWGLEVYSLDGQRVQRLEVGRVNNVDLRQNVLQSQDIAVASNRTANTLTVFAIDPAGVVTHLGDHALALNEPYGSCMYQDTKGAAHVFVNDKDGRYEQWQIVALRPLQLTRVRTFSIPSQPEGCTANDHSGQLYFGEEAQGIWQLDLNDPNAQPQLLTTVNEGALVADVEGMDIYHGEQGPYLIVSSQGDFSYAVYALAETLQYKGSFRVISDAQSGIDGAQETDGLAVHAARVDARFPLGIVVVQDGFNTQPREAQNFKYLSWKDIAEALAL